MGNKQHQLERKSKDASSGPPKKASVKKLAIVIGASDYSSSSFKSLPHASHDALQMEMFLKAHHYKIMYTNLNAYDKYESASSGKVYAGTVIEKIETLLLKASMAKDKGRYYHFFIYYSGHGRLLEDSKETCGIDSYGDLIPFESYSKRFSQQRNCLSIMFLDCDRLKFEQNDATDTYSPVCSSESEKNEPTGISIVKYGCERFKAKQQQADLSVSLETHKFLNLIRNY